jgi:hypothetical protein
VSPHAGQGTDPLDHLEDVAHAWLALAQAHARAACWEEALRAAHVAARVMAAQNRRLAWPELEDLLQQAAAAIGPGASDPPREASHAPACLHVLTEALEAGGHSAMAWRWIRLDSVHPVQHAVLLSHDAPVPAALAEAVRARGGHVHQPPPGSGFVEQARWLRALASALAQRVVLHVDVADVVAATAFGTPGGPTVMLVNHAAHLYATGVRSADTVIDCRGSWLEQAWTALHRGARRHANVPIPLEEAPVTATAAARARTAARQALGLGPEHTVVLTLGAHFKFSPVAGLDFVATWERILAARPQAVLVAAGFVPDARWRTAASRCGGRIVLPGVVPRAQVASLHAAADLYAEGFAFGTTTALLEAGLAGVPAILPPLPCAPPLATDGLAVDGLLPHPVGVPAYEHLALALLDGEPTRRRLGELLKASIRAHHTGAGWQRHLQAAVARLPARHAPSAERPPLPTPAADHRRWSTHARAWTTGPEGCIDRSLMHAISLGLGGQLAAWLTPALQASCQRHAALRRGQAIPLPVLRALAWPGLGFATLARRSPGAAQGVLRALSFVTREGLPRRIGQRVARALGRAEAPRGAYDDYRVAPATHAHAHAPVPAPAPASQWSLPTPPRVSRS